MNVDSGQRLWPKRKWRTTTTAFSLAQKMGYTYTTSWTKALLDRSGHTTIRKLTGRQTATMVKSRVWMWQTMYHTSPSSQYADSPMMTATTQSAECHSRATAQHIASSHPWVSTRSRRWKPAVLSVVRHWYIAEWISPMSLRSRPRVLYDSPALPSPWRTALYI